MTTVGVNPHVLQRVASPPGDSITEILTPEVTESPGPTVVVTVTVD